jgi:CIC family chloride channel protein
MFRRAFKRLPNERSRVFALTIVVGGVCGLCAVAFHAGILWATAQLLERSLAISGTMRLAAMVLTPALGALLAGIVLEYIVPAARGSGIQQVKLVYALGSGRLRLRDALGKFVVTTLQLGTGSSLGREGPTVHICASISSALGRAFGLSPQNCARFIPVGAAAGIAAAFNAPIAAVTFTIEEIVGDLDQTLLSGVVVAAALAAAVEHSILGGHPVFSVPGAYELEHVSSLLVYAMLGVAAALASLVFYSVLLGLRLRLRRGRRCERALIPGLGGLTAGLLAVGVHAWLKVDGVLGDGHDSLSAALVGALAIHVMVALATTKLLATAACYSTGGAGGIFAPVLFIGGMLGGIFGHVDQLLLHPGGGEFGAFALVGMGAFFAAAIRAPITSVLIIFEMTRSYGLILPLMIASSVAYILARLWRPVPIYEALLLQDGLQLPDTKRAAVALSTFRVHDAMTTELVALQANESVASALARIQSHDFSMYPVVDEHGALAGLVSQARLKHRLAEGRGSALVAGEAREEACLRSDLALVDAVAKMSALAARQMAVVEGDSRRLVGVLAMSDVLRAHTEAARSTVSVEISSVRKRSRSAVKLKRRDASLAFRNPAREPGDIPPT